MICGIALCGAGCTQLTIVGDDHTQTEWKLGVLAVDLGPPGGNAVVSASGFGVIATPAGTNLGFSKSRVVQLGEQCRVVVLPKDFDVIGDDRELLRLLKSTQKACAA